MRVDREGEVCEGGLGGRDLSTRVQLVHVVCVRGIPLFIISTSSPPPGRTLRPAQQARES